jgi:hypothetical protein
VGDSKFMGDISTSIDSDDYSSKNDLRVTIVFSLLMIVLLGIILLVLFHQNCTNEKQQQFWTSLHEFWGFLLRGCKKKPKVLHPDGLTDSE